MKITNQTMLRWLGFTPSHPGARMTAEMPLVLWVQVFWARVTGKRPVR